MTTTAIAATTSTLLSQLTLRPSPIPSSRQRDPWLHHPPRPRIAIRARGLLLTTFLGAAYHPDLFSWPGPLPLEYLQQRTDALYPPGTWAVIHAKMIALQRFIEEAEWPTYRAAHEVAGPAEVVFVFVPAVAEEEWERRQPVGAGRFLTFDEFRTAAGKHRYLCKCGVPNNGLLDLVQSAGTESLGEARSWYMAHAVRERRGWEFGGLEAPVWDPFPDGGDRRGQRARCEGDEEVETKAVRGGEVVRLAQLQKELRRQAWSASTGRTGPFGLGDRALRKEAWVPEGVVPPPKLEGMSGPVAEKVLRWEVEAREEQARRSSLQARLWRDHQESLRTKGVERLAVGSGAMDSSLVSSASSSAHRALFATSCSATSLASMSSLIAQGSSASRPQTRQPSLERPAFSFSSEQDAAVFQRPSRGCSRLRIMNPADNLEVKAGPSRSRRSS